MTDDRAPADPLRDSELPLRDDLVAGHAAAWRHVARSGAWWNGVERVAIAAATRDAWSCAACDRRAAALSPEIEVSEHGRGVAPELQAHLAEPVVDAVHRLVREPARLSRRCSERLFASGAVSPAAYAELVGVVTQAVSLDALHLALGIGPAPLPEPEGGEPSQYEPQGLAWEDAWVPMILPANLGEAERDLYGDPTGNVVRALSAVPDEVRAMKALSAAQYIAIEQMRDYVGGERVGRAISRAQMELVAGRISALHECFY
ncbi:MAG: hypothetical protein DWQ36_02255 [Acidobacteria bacterium]|nr:MAG: hypothetical protein DWQ30_23645 [Acidobacteriota bacterium]REK11266.1 MAG: hypothetical protein DWQ36_02255 [Acidobacteriota bacterium]